jgi:hypothetical protein
MRIAAAIPLFTVGCKYYITVKIRRLQVGIPLPTLDAGFPNPTGAFHGWR